jgi:hypothetical protein
MAFFNDFGGKKTSPPRDIFFSRMKKKERVGFGDGWGYSKNKGGEA